MARSGSSRLIELSFHFLPRHLRPLSHQVHVRAGGSIAHLIGKIDVPERLSHQDVGSGELSLDRSQAADAGAFGGIDQLDGKDIAGVDDLDENVLSLSFLVSHFHVSRLFRFSVDEGGPDP